MHSYWNNLPQSADSVFLCAVALQCTTHVQNRGVCTSFLCDGCAILLFVKSLTDMSTRTNSLSLSISNATVAGSPPFPACSTRGCELGSRIYFLCKRLDLLIEDKVKTSTCSRHLHDVTFTYPSKHCPTNEYMLAHECERCYQLPASQHLGTTSRNTTSSKNPSTPTTKARKG